MSKRLRCSSGAVKMMVKTMVNKKTMVNWLPSSPTSTLTSSSPTSTLTSSSPTSTLTSTLTSSSPTSTLSCHLIQIVRHRRGSWFLTSSSWVNHSSVDAAFEHYCTDFGIDTSSALYVSCLVASKAGFGIDYVSTWLSASTLSF